MTGSGDVETQPGGTGNGRYGAVSGHSELIRSPTRLDRIQSQSADPIRTLNTQGYILNLDAAEIRLVD
jgi:hypothetical protein